MEPKVKQMQHYRWPHLKLTFKKIDVLKIFTKKKRKFNVKMEPIGCIFPKIRHVYLPQAPVARTTCPVTQAVHSVLAGPSHSAQSGWQATNIKKTLGLRHIWYQYNFNTRL